MEDVGAIDDLRPTHEPPDSVTEPLPQSTAQEQRHPATGTCGSETVRPARSAPAEPWTPASGHNLSEQLFPPPARWPRWAVLGYHGVAFRRENRRAWPFRIGDMT